MQTKCPYCGHVEEVIDEYWGQRMACCACGREYEVAIVHLKRSDFHSGDATVKCPLCGEGNVLPITAINRKVRCGVCGGKFYTEMRRSVNEIKVVKNIPPENGNAHLRHTQQGAGRLESGKLNLSLKHNLKWIIIIAIVICVAPFVFWPTKMLALVYPILPNAIEEKLQQRQYEKILMWYDAQLEYNDLYESNVINHRGEQKLVFSDGTSIEMYEGNGLGTRLYYSSNLPKGFAKELIEARMFINDYERSHNFQRTRVRNLMYGGLSKRPSDARR